MGNAHPATAKMLTALCGCLLILMTPCAAPGADSQRETNGQDASAAFRLGQLSLTLGAQVHGIVREQLKACPHVKCPGIASIGQDVVLETTLETRCYRGTVYRPFHVRCLKPGNATFAEFYVRTTSPWTLSGDIVIPAETYLAFAGATVAATDAAGIAVQQTALTKNDTLRETYLAQAKSADRQEASLAEGRHRTALEECEQRIKEIRAEIAKIMNQRAEARKTIKQAESAGRAVETMIESIEAHDTETGELLWRWKKGKLRFFDGLNKARAHLARARRERGTLKRQTPTGHSKPKTKTGRIKAAHKKLSQRILLGEALSEEDMRAGYEKALGEAG